MSLFNTATGLFYNSQPAQKAFLNGTQVWSLVQEPIQDPVLYSNLDVYIIDGVRQATTATLIRANVSAVRRFIVTQTVSIQSITLLRIPPSNWTSTNYNITGTLSVFSGSGGTIDGSTSNKGFVTTQSILNPPTGRTGALTEYDVKVMRPSNLSQTVLTPGEYNYTILGTSANMDIAVLNNTLFTIDTTRPIYPSPTAATTHFVVEIV